MNGTSGSTSFVDSSLNSYTITSNGDAQISTAEVKFGSGSSIFDGSGDYLHVTDMTSVKLGYNNTPFTVELWVYRTLTETTEVFFAKHGGVANWNGTNGLAFELYIDSSDYLNWNFYGTGGLVYLNDSASIPDSQWVHLAVSYDGITTRMFVDGVLLGNTSTDNYGNTTQADKLQISGEVDDSFCLNGYIDDFRIMDTCEYTSNFTPPSSQFPDP